VAYQKQSVRVLSNGLNLLPPGDKLNEGDAVAFQNWRADQAGRLRSRKGTTHWTSRLSGGVPHTLYRGFPNWRYVGVGTLLYRGIGGSFGSSIASGFDGSALGMASYQGYTWVMNRSKQGKDNGSSWSNWLLSAPATAPSAVVGAQATKSIVSFDSTETWNVRDPFGDYDAHTDFADTNKIEGTGALRLACTHTGTWYVEQTFATVKDLGVDATQKDADEFRIWFWTDNPAAIEEITVAIDVNDGTFAVDYYQVSWKRSDGTAQWNGMAMWSWIQLKAFRKIPQILPTDENYIELTNQFSTAPGFVRTGDTAAKDWSTAKAIRVQIRVSYTVTNQFDYAFFVGGVSGNLDGEVYYYQTNDTADGHESNPSPVSTAITISKRAATVTLVACDDTLCTKRHLYRIGSGLSKALRVGTVNDRATTATWTDIGDNDTAQANNIEMPIDHDAPPAARGMVGPYFGRLISFSSAAHPARFWWTNVAQPWFWPGSDDEVGNWNEAGEASEEILNCTNHRRLLVMYKARGIWRLFGDPDSAEPELVDGSRSAVGASAIADAGDIDYFVATDGIYSFNGDSSQKISGKIDPIFKGDYCLLYGTTYAVPIYADYIQNSVLEYAFGQLFFSYCEDLQGTTPTVTLVYDISSKTWAMHRMNSTTVGCGGGFAALYYEGQRNPLMGAIYSESFGAQVLELEYGHSDDGQAMYLLWQSAYLDQEMPDTEKVYCDLVIDYYSEDALTVTMVFNNSVEVPVGSLLSATRARATFSLGPNGLGYRAYNAAVRIEGYSTHEAVVFACYLHFYVDAREGKTFDTGVIDLGDQRAKQIDRIEIDYEAVGAVVWYLLSDLPGPTFAQRDTGEFAAAASRSVVGAGITGGGVVEGRRFRLVMVSSSTFRLHGIRVRVRPIAEYIDGAQGETWKSAEVNYGV